MLFTGVNGSGESPSIGLVMVWVPTECTSVVHELEGMGAEPMGALGMGLFQFWGCVCLEGQIERVAFGEGSPFGWLDGESLMALEVSLVGFSWGRAEGAHQHVVIGGEVVWIFKVDGLEEAAIGAQNVVAVGFITDAKACLGPGVEASVAVVLSEVGEKIIEAIGCKEVGHLV